MSGADRPVKVVVAGLGNMGLSHARAYHDSPGYKIACECYSDKAKKHERGVIAMAHAGRNTGGSQFYIAFKATPHLDGKHTVFGRVTDGMDAVDAIEGTETGHNDRPVEDQAIERIDLN